eukprot:1829205-Rhodomonas_salina.1
MGPGRLGAQSTDTLAVGAAYRSCSIPLVSEHVMPEVRPRDRPQRHDLVGKRRRRIKGNQLRGQHTCVCPSEMTLGQYRKWCRARVGDRGVVRVEEAPA